MSDDWVEGLPPDERQSWERFVTNVRADTIRKMESSAFVMTLVPDEVDVKFAVELGLAIMLDKPILAVAANGTHLPRRLREIADRVIVVDDLDLKEDRDKLAIEIAAFMHDEVTNGR